MDGALADRRALETAARYARGMNQYITPPEAADCIAWIQEGDWWYSIEPIYDASTGLYARFTYEGASAAARYLHAELPTRDDIIALRRVGFPLSPVMLPDADMLRSVGLPPHSPESQINAYRTEHMGSIEWARIHDERVRAALVSGGWDGQQRVANAGKHWIAGAPPGRAYLMGWWDGTGWIQSGLSALTPGSPGPHDSQHHDYGTTTILKRRNLEA